jgi:ribosomal protein S18 acetylase RimI-like enzyme
MADMLVKLLTLPPRVDVEGVTIRRARPFEATAVRAFIEEHFNNKWADEAVCGLPRHPATLLLATESGRDGEKSATILGFAAYDVTARGFFGPTGVDPTCRGRGVGKALLIEALHGLRELGYVYGIIGGVGPAEFYAKAVGAVPIAGSTPGVYGDLLRE